MKIMYTVRFDNQRIFQWKQLLKANEEIITKAKLRYDLGNPLSKNVAMEMQ